MTAVAEITARIAEIRTQLNSVAALNPSPGGDFSAALEQAQRAGGTGSSSGSAASGTSGASGASGAGAAAGAAGKGSGYKGVTGQDVVAEARKYLGIPYVWGGTNPKVGLDCSGLVQLVYKKLGIKLPRVSQDQAHEGKRIQGLKNAKPGDLLTFGDPAHHIGIYIGNGKMLHAPHTGTVVKIIDLDGYQKPTDIRRILPDEAAAATSRGSSAAGTAGAAGAAAGTAGTAGAGAAGGVSAALRKVPYSELFIKAGAKYDVPPALLAAVAKAESGFNPRVVSSAGAQGLMQFMPGTAREMGVNPLNPASAVDGAARMLRDLIKDFGSVRLALAAYNAGPGAVRRYDGVPPYSETQNYVRRVQKYMTAFD